MPEAAPRRGEPTPVPRVVLCPYCGEVSKDPARCGACRGNFDPLSRQATQNSMGPWFIRDATNPNRPGCSFEVLRGLVARGKIEPNTVMRGPTTNQFWTPARRAPGVANLLGLCHNCAGPAGPDDVACLNCGATFRYHQDRQHLGLTEVRLLPGQATPEAIARGFVAETPVARGAPRPVAPRTSLPTPSPAPVAAEQVPAAPQRETVEGTEGRGGVPAWVFVLAGTAVVGAVVSAAWIMGKLPGFPSPVTSGGGGSETSTPMTEAGSNAQTAEPGPDSGEPPTEVPGVWDAGTDGVQERAATPEPPAAPAPSQADLANASLAEARGLLARGTEDSLQQAAKLEESTGAGVEWEALRRATARLQTQLSLRRLP